MAYPLESNETFSEKLLSFKEFYQLIPTDRKQPFTFTRENARSHKLLLQSYQHFTRNFLNPNTPYKRILLKQSTGVGKTAEALAIAMEFIRYYKHMYTTLLSKMPATKKSQMEADKLTPTVYIFGFANTQTAFMRDLLKFPEFGFITHSEIEELERLRMMIHSGRASLADIKHERELLVMYKRRITNKNRGGFFKFYGYQEFVYRIFTSDDNITLIDIDAEATKSGLELHEVINKYISEGKIRINKSLLERFENSLIICDEVHNIYNSITKNNYGVAIQFILDTVTNLRAIFMSATPVNNSPAEVVDILNLLSPVEKKITRRELFSGRNLRPDAIQKIQERCIGRISFLQDLSPRYFPRRKFIGQSWAPSVELFGMQEFPYLKFIPCVMSKLHVDTVLTLGNLPPTEPNDEISDDESEYEPSADDIASDMDDEIEHKKTKAVATRVATPSKLRKQRPAFIEETDETGRFRVPTDGYSIYDIALPNPRNENIGIYRSRDLRIAYASASNAWRDKNGITYTEGIISGDFMLRKNIVKYSTKHAALLDHIEQLFNATKSPSTSPKFMIYHNHVHMSGVIFIQELLKYNGFIDEISEPNNTTKCSVCGRIQSSHHKLPADIEQHPFYPSRFIVVHSEVDKKQIESKMNKFNSPENANGHLIKAFIGSKLIRESYEILCVQHLFVLSLPTNISTLIQVFGRVVRKNSHIDLPPEQRNVFIYMFMSVFDRSTHPEEIAPEEYRYASKLHDYRIIQQIEREMNKWSIDARVNWNINMPNELLAEYFPQMNNNTSDNTNDNDNGKIQPFVRPNGEPVDTLGALYFDLPPIGEKSLADLNTTRFSAYEPKTTELNTIIMVVKKLFLEKSVYTYEELLNTVRDPPFHMEINMKLIAEENFAIVLSRFCAPVIKITQKNATNVKSSNAPIVFTGLTQSQLSDTLARLFNPDELLIYSPITGRPNKIEQIGKYYILFPVEETPDGFVCRRDVESFIRTAGTSTSVVISLDKYIETNLVFKIYEDQRNTIIRWISSENSPYRNVAQGRADMNLKLFIEITSRYDTEFFMRFTTEAIEYHVAKGANVMSASAGHIYEKFIAMMDEFGHIIRVSDIYKFKDTVNKFMSGRVFAKDGSAPVLPQKTPIGFVGPFNVRLCDGVGNWIEVGKATVGKATVFKENNGVVGYFDEVGGKEFKFKIRPSTGARSTSSDARNVERGIVCMTKKKEELLKMVEPLNIKGIGQIAKSRDICDTILYTLVELERKQRLAGTSIKYFYLPNERDVTIK